MKSKKRIFVCTYIPSIKGKKKEVYIAEQNSKIKIEDKGGNPLPKKLCEEISDYLINNKYDKKEYYITSIENSWWLCKLNISSNLGTIIIPGIGRFELEAFGECTNKMKLLSKMIKENN